MYSSQRENTVYSYFIDLLLAVERTTSLPTDISACSEEHNAVIQNTLCANSKTCRRTVDPLFQSYVQQTESGVMKLVLASSRHVLFVFRSFLI